MADPKPPPTNPPVDAPPETPGPIFTDLRTGTEVTPDVILHHAAFLQGADYSDPYPPLPDQASGTPYRRPLF